MLLLSRWDVLGIRMVVILLNLLLVAQFLVIFASGSIQSRDCGNFHVSVSSDEHDLLYIRGELVHKDLFCKFVQENNCFFRRNVETHYCSFQFDDLHLQTGRKILQNVVREENIQKHLSKKGKDYENPLLTYKYLAMGVPGVFILCCAFLCPCFQRRKENAHTVLAKDPVSSLDSSMEMNSISERTIASPHRVPPSPSRFSLSPQLSRLGSIHLNMNQVVKATKNFSPSLRVGEGGFGTVYKANLQDGQVVAIKRARREHFESLRTEFRSEIELLTKIDHRNLVKLLGFVDNGNERLIITEFVPNGTLREHLDGMRGNYLDFNQRLEISIDIAHGLTYLHLYAEKQIIHRDVKSSNILLTDTMRAKVADFGFARLGETDSERTHVVTQVKGTVGYLDPEYMKTHQLTPKSDVYSFGILLLEILTGRRPVELKRPPDERITIRWAFKKYDEGNVMEMVDPQIRDTVDKDIWKLMFGLAIECAAPTRGDRPDMKSVGEQLWGIRMDYLKTGRKT